MLVKSTPEAVSHRLTEFKVGKRDIAHAELQRHHEVHQPDHECHRHEEDHDRAVSREYLIEMFRRQIALRRADGDRLLRAHHDRVGEAAQQHHQRQNAIHHADALVIDRRQPFTPKIGPISLERDPATAPATRQRSSMPTRIGESAGRTGLRSTSACRTNSTLNPPCVHWRARAAPARCRDRQWSGRDWARRHYR